MKSKVIGLVKHTNKRGREPRVTSPSLLAAWTKAMNPKFNPYDHGEAERLNNIFKEEIGGKSGKGDNKSQTRDWGKTPLFYDSSSPQLRAALARALDPKNKVITVRQASLIHQVYFEGKTISQIAREENRTYPTISSAISTGILRLLRNLDRPECISRNNRFNFERYFNPIE